MVETSIRLEQELPYAPCPQPRCHSTPEGAGTIHGTIPSRLIGKWCRSVCTLGCTTGPPGGTETGAWRAEANVNYRHVIGSLVRKPRCLRPLPGAAVSHHALQADLRTLREWRRADVEYVRSTWRRPPWKPRWTARCRYCRVSPSTAEVRDGRAQGSRPAPAENLRLAAWLRRECRRPPA